MALQIWTMDVDGSNKRQVTKNKAANFGPSFFQIQKELFFLQTFMIVAGEILVYMR